MCRGWSRPPNDAGVSRVTHFRERKNQSRGRNTNGKRDGHVVTQNKNWQATKDWVLERQTIQRTSGSRKYFNRCCFFIATSAPACVCMCECRYTLTCVRLCGWFRPLHGFNLARQLLYSLVASASSEVHKGVSNIEISGCATLGLHAAVPASTTLIHVAGW